MPAGHHPNRLAQSSSLYLRQHADGPIDWWPWSAAAFDEARRRDVPVLISIGYSACHWCHVMASESFDDRAVAAALNAGFVAIKVDREERPDVDELYMDATFEATGRGGWPLTVFADHDGRPFSCGTYYPPIRSGRVPSFTELLSSIATAWQHDRDRVAASAAALTAALVAAPPPGGAVPPPHSLQHGIGSALADFDDEFGGFGTGAKFPQPLLLELLLRAGGDAAERGVRTIEAIADGAIHDQLGGGFHRYTTDRRWRVPHFEKMLYDQALLGRCLLGALQLTGDDRHRVVLRRLLDYVRADLVVGGGGLASSEAADSGGVEGGYYTWSLAEVESALGSADGRRAAAWWGITAAGNLGESRRTTPHRPPPQLRPQAADAPSPGEVEAWTRTLLDIRRRRPRPRRDDKVITEWNALMIGTFADAGAALGRQDWIDTAVGAAEYLLAELRGADGRWLRARSAGSTDGEDAFAGDHVALIDAWVRVAEATGERRWLELAVDTADVLIGEFWDARTPGVFTSAAGRAPLVARRKDVIDNAVASSNSLAAVALQRLSAATGIEGYAARAGALIAAAPAERWRSPHGGATLWSAALLHGEGVQQLLVTGDRADLRAVAAASWSPNLVVVWGERAALPIWHGRPDDGRAYLCRDHTCLAPIDSPAALADTLRDRR